MKVFIDNLTIEIISGSIYEVCTCYLYRFQPHNLSGL